MYGCESWTIKKAECQRINAFELWCWRRPLRVPWTAKRSNQSILKENSPEYYWKDWCWSWNSNTLATWFEELNPWKRPRCWERLGAGGEGDDRGIDAWMKSLTWWTWIWASSRSWWWTEKPGVLQAMGSESVGHDWATKLSWFFVYLGSGWIWPLWMSCGIPLTQAGQNLHGVVFFLHGSREHVYLHIICRSLSQLPSSK